MPPEILRLAQEYMKDIEEIRLNKEELGLDTIDQSYLMVMSVRSSNICVILSKVGRRSRPLFLLHQQRTQRLASELRQEKFKAITIHGDLSQRQRDNAMYRFKRGSEDILVVQTLRHGELMFQQSVM